MSSITFSPQLVRTEKPGSAASQVSNTSKMVAAVVVVTYWLSSVVVPYSVVSVFVEEFSVTVVVVV